MYKEKDLIVLISLVAFGVIVASVLTVLLQINVVAPVTLFGILMFPLLLLQSRKKFNNFSENLEKIVFIITLFIIALSFAVLYKPL
ncbi:MAG: energy-converting hydrogenase A, subunit K [Methanobrevibacter sp.]|nr:energy-converting hydrogenase A, subunit K [Methanobrevibacter sp.]